LTQKPWKGAAWSVRETAREKEGLVSRGEQGGLHRLIRADEKLFSGVTQAEELLRAKRRGDKINSQNRDAGLGFT